MNTALIHALSPAPQPPAGADAAHSIHYPQEKVEKFGASSAFGRPAQPIEIAPIFFFLASSEPRFVSAELYGATGGQTPYWTGNLPQWVTDIPVLAQYSKPLQLGNFLGYWGVGVVAVSPSLRTTAIQIMTDESLAGRLRTKLNFEDAVKALTKAEAKSYLARPCAKCKWDCAFRSKRRTTIDLFLALFFLRPFRCRSCRRRFYRPSW